VPQFWRATSNPPAAPSGIRRPKAVGVMRIIILKYEVRAGLRSASRPITRAAPLRNVKGMNNNMIALRSFDSAAIADAGLAWCSREAGAASAKTTRAGLASRSRSARAHKVALSTIAVALAATACTPAAANGNNANDAASASAAVQQGPLTELLNGALGLNVTPAERERQFNEQHRIEEESIAQCMTNAGFEYLPNINPNPTDFDSMFRPTDREWVAQYGFATVRTPWDADNAQPTYTDPNAAYLASLSPAELAAFNSALYGAMADVNYMSAEDMGDVEDLLANSGCWGEAQQQTIANSATATFYTAEFAPLTEAIMNFFDKVRDDITEADRDWVTCMANAGHTGFQRQSDAAASIVAEQDDLMGRFNWDNWDDSLGYPSAANYPALAELADRETELALADFDCRATTNFDARRSAFQVDAEKQFVSDHKAELNALQAAVEQNR